MRLCRQDPPDYEARLKAGAKPFALRGKDLAGKAVSLADYKGKVLVLYFWATWCPPSRAEMPNVVAAYDKYHGAGFDIVGISLDQADGRVAVKSFIKEHKMQWRQIYDGKQWSAANAVTYGVQVIPFSLIVGRDGTIAAVDVRGEDLGAAIKKALART